MVIMMRVQEEEGTKVGVGVEELNQEDSDEDEYEGYLEYVDDDDKW